MCDFRRVTKVFSDEHSRDAVSQQNETDIIVDADSIKAVAEEIRVAGCFAMDLEFVSADRFIPDLALVQIAWQGPDEQRLVLLDGAHADLGPIWELVGDESVLLVSHGAKQDLSLLATRYSIRAGGFVDTQIAAAFAGLGEQVGYARLVEEMLGARLDKASQFTDWLARPLSDRQLRYALDDVRYLLPVWTNLRDSLDSSGRLGWAFEESAELAAQAAQRRAPDEAYKSLGGWNGLKGSALASLRMLAAWREELAVEENIPPSWIVPDAAVVELCRRRVRSERELRNIRGIGSATVRKYGEAILEALERGAQDEVAPPPGRRPLEPAGLAQAAVVTAMVAGRAAAIGISPRSIAAKADAEELIRHALGELPLAETRLLRGWRGEVIGVEALEWVRGERAVLADEVLGVTVVALPPPSQAPSGS